MRKASECRRSSCAPRGNRKPIADTRALKVIRKQLKAKNRTAVRDMDREERNEALMKLKKAGLSVRQIERLKGIGRGTVQKVQAAVKGIVPVVASYREFHQDI